jgi:hypothetical protein
VSWRDVAYGALKLSNDVRAVRRGRIGQRIVRRVAGRAFGRAMGRWVK